MEIGGIFDQTGAAGKSWRGRIFGVPYFVRFCLLAMLAIPLFSLSPQR